MLHKINIYLFKNKGKWRTIIKSNFRSTIRIQQSISENQNIELSEQQIDNIVDKQVPSERHLRIIYYYLYQNNWLKAHS